MRNEEGFTIANTKMIRITIFVRSGKIGKIKSDIMSGTNIKEPVKRIDKERHGRQDEQQGHFDFV